MAWTNPPRTWVAAELETSSIFNTHVRDQFTALYAGAMSIASQAAGDLIYGASAAQLGRLSGTGLVRLNGTSAPTVTSPIAMALIFGR